MSFGKKIRLGKRLQQIESMITNPYDHIWDCCCDHGLLGAALLSRHAAPNIYFVDVVPDLMQQLEQKLKQFFPTTPDPRTQWQVHCMDATALPLHTLSGKHLVIIAGIGGDLMSELVRAIYQKNSACEIDFLLCPVHHQFTLRQLLIQLDFSLQSERLIVENQRHYEILLVSTTKSSGSNINPIGSLIWQCDTPEQATIAAEYRKKTLEHYQRVQLRTKAEVQHIIDAYSTINTGQPFL